LNKESDTYERLARDPFGLSSLWLGENHLVYVRGSGFLLPFSEQYKRFSFDEIQALMLARSSRTGTVILHLFLLFLFLVPAALILGLSDSLGLSAAIVVAILLLASLACLALLVRHLVLGPTCVCDLQTSTTRERLRPLNRYHRTREVIARIDGLVRESQAGLAGPGAEGVSPSPRSPARRMADFYEIPRPVPFVFGSFLFLGIFGLGALHLESVLATGGIMLLVVATSLLLSISLVGVVRRPTPESIRLVLWSQLGLQFLLIGAAAVYYLIAATRDVSYTIGMTGPLEAFTGIPSEGGWIGYGLFLGIFSGYLLSGVAGLLLASKWRRNIRKAQALAGMNDSAKDDGGVNSEPGKA